MTAHLPTISRRLVTGLLILAVLVSILAEPLTAWAKSLSIPATCIGGNFTLLGEVVASMDVAAALAVRDPASNPENLPAADQILGVFHDLCVAHGKTSESISPKSLI